MTQPTPWRTASRAAKLALLGLAAAVLVACGGGGGSQPVVTALAPKTTDISPKIATLNVPVTFAVSGSNLPSTTVLSMQDANCSAPTGLTSGGFSTICTALSTGVKTITIKTNTLANSGKVIDATRMVTVTSTTLTPTSKLPHSGITASQCYSAGSNTLMACSGVANDLNAQQDGHRASLNAMSYSKVGFSGEALDSNASSWCAVKDNETGLVWQNHQAAPATFTNLGHNRAGDASKYAADNATLCGQSGWRLPTVDELQSIVDYSKPWPGPTINTTWFPNTPGNWYWSSSPYVGDSSYAWYVNFYNGVVSYSGRNGNGLNRVRLVRASQ